MGKPTITEITASEGMVFTDVATQTLRGTTLYLGVNDCVDNYMQIPKDTPLPGEAGDTYSPGTGEEATAEDLYNALAELGVKSDEEV